MYITVSVADCSIHTALIGEFLSSQTVVVCYCKVYFIIISFKFSLTFYVSDSKLIFRHMNASSELYVRLEECFEQLHLLEKEEKHVSNLLQCVI